MTATFGELLRHDVFVEMPCVHDPLMSSLAARLGFDGVLISGSMAAGYEYGIPDGWQTPGEMVQRVQAARAVTDLPIMVDLDDAGGTPPHVYRNIRAAEFAGANAIMLEDTDCANRFLWDDTAGRWDYFKARMRPTGAAVDNLRLARTALRNPTTFLVARTEAMAVGDYDDAMKRAHAFVDAGADAVFMPQLPNDLIGQVVGALPVPLLVTLDAAGTKDERDALIASGARIFAYHQGASPHSPSMYNQGAQVLARLRTVMTGDQGPRLTPVLREWLEGEVPASVKERMGHGA